MTHLRGVRLTLLVALLLAAVGAAFYFRQHAGPKGPLRTRLLETKFAEAEFQSGASAGELLALASRIADETIKTFPGDPGALSVQARRHYLLSETEEATSLWREALKLDPNFAEAYFGLGLVALDRDNYQEALERFEDVNRLGGDDPRVPVLLAKSLLFTGRAEDAVLLLEHHVESEHTSAEAWEMLGQAYLQCRQFERAAKCFQVATEAAPGMKDAVYGLARSHAMLGNTDKARLYTERFSELSQAARLENAEGAKLFEDRKYAAHVAAQTHADAARIYLHNGAIERSEELLLRAISLEPSNTQFLEQLQRSFQERGALAEAVELGERITELEPRKLEQWLNLAWLYSQLDQAEQALAACKKAIALNPDDPRCRQAYEIVQQAD